ncbi:MAG: STAS domain-containing protein [Candidatus Eremiobacteraeota bacterium]|nr:STAS domain-containing protein [Candidatus Eremiobacteraeota bacterium]MBC5804305.1 STAS domain-containing protein [Candidatus Eremiobacteraeota bacterium]MBC5822086.1 STAS domain-containing protein [Candidatus Eremiobacteraeota bacterium]
MENAGGAIIVKVRGELDISGRDAFRRALTCASSGSTGAVIVSLEDCSYCDCSAVGVIAALRHTIGSRLHVVIPESSPLRRLFDLCGLLTALDVAPSLTQTLPRTTFNAAAQHALSA